MPTWRDSSKLAHLAYHEVTAKIIRTYINTASRLLRYYKGEIRSFEGDRVMAIFVGGTKNTDAVRAAFAISWAVRGTATNHKETNWSDIARSWSLDHGIGIATGKALIVREGVRDNNDLISVGEAPNIAAKLSELRRGPSLYITANVYSRMLDRVKYAMADSANMWNQLNTIDVGGTKVNPYASTYYWKP